MKIRSLFFLACATFSSILVHAGNIYYVDNIKGNNANSGKTQDAPWKSLEKINNVKFVAGDRIYLKRGQSFRGFLDLKGSGKSNAPILVGAYGTGQRPVIDATGYNAGLIIMDSDHWYIENIEIRGSGMAGILIGCTRDELVLNHFRIDNCLVQNIGDTSKLDWDFSKSTGGIIVVNGTLDVNKEGKPVFYNSSFNDVVINNCTVRYNHRWTSISISSGKPDGLGGNNNYIRNCTAEYSAADGIRMNGVRNSFIEYSVMYRNGAWPVFPGKNLGGLGAWFFDADNCAIQYCEAGYVQAATTDGGAFDIDYWQTNSTIQYSYGHHCAGYGVSVFGADATRPTVNSVVRYNILKDNGRDSAFAYQGDFYVFTWNGGLLNGVNIHDNISFWNPASNAHSLKFNADFTGSNPNTFTRNTIYSQHPWLAFFKTDSLKADSNTYWVSNDQPVWELRKNQYTSLKDWQKQSGLDTYSRYDAAAVEFPVWHKPGIQSSLKLNKIKGSLKKDSKAPLITTSAFDKGPINLRDLKGNPVLLSFITLSDKLGQNDKVAMEAQLTFIKSMRRQYEGQGLKIILVEASKSQKGNALPNEQLQNFVNDNELGNILFVADKAGTELASAYKIGILPTSFLIDRDGIITQKWENLVLPAALAFAIEDELKK